MKCFESAGPAIFLSYAPSFFGTKHPWIDHDLPKKNIH